jgi:hypothetical protein
MAHEIEEAIKRANEKKRAILQGADTGAVDVDSFVSLMSGFDLDPDEFLGAIVAVSNSGVRQLIETKNANLVLASMFVDGLSIGLLIADARERKAAAR